MAEKVDIATIREDFDRLALLSGEGWNHNNHYHRFLLKFLKNGHIKEPEGVREAWAAHGRHDSYLTLAQLRDICRAILPGARVRKHLLWRYSLIWKKMPDS